MTGLLLVHGRSQELPRRLRQDRSQVTAHIQAMTRVWLAGLAKGVALAQRQPVQEAVVALPFYGDLLADLIDAHEAAGGRRPDLESMRKPGAAPAACSPEGAATTDRVDRTTDQLLLEAADRLGFDPASRLARTSPELAAQLEQAEAARSAGEEFAWSDLLRNSVVREALQFLAEKTDTPQWIIEHYLRDVAYYLRVDDIRAAVLEVVREGVRGLLDRGHEDLVVVGHSLGSVVAYDLCREDLHVPLRLFVTAGSPLGFPAVLDNLPHLRRPPDPPPLTPKPAWTGAAWVNAFDPRDVVALVHPLAPVFGGAAQVRDEQTQNPTAPHSVEDYLADPDVGGRIADALAAP